MGNGVQAFRPSINVRSPGKLSLPQRLHLPLQVLTRKPKKMSARFIPVPAAAATPVQAERRTADYTPSEWGDHFLTHAPDLTV